MCVFSWWLCVVRRQLPTKTTISFIFIFLIFCRLKPPQTTWNCPPIRSTAVASLNNTSPHHRCCLFVGCCVSLHHLVAIATECIFSELPSKTTGNGPSQETFCRGQILSRIHAPALVLFWLVDVLFWLMAAAWSWCRVNLPVGILPDGYVRTNPQPQIPTKQSVPPSKDSLLGYYRIPIAIPTLRSLVGPAIDKVRIPWLSFH